MLLLFLSAFLSLFLFKLANLLFFSFLELLDLLSCERFGPEGHSLDAALRSAQSTILRDILFDLLHTGAVLFYEVVEHFEL